MKFFLWVGTFLSLFCVSASAQEPHKVGEDWKTAFAADTHFVQLKILFDSLINRELTHEYDVSKTPLDTSLLKHTPDSLVNDIRFLIETLDKKYPMLNQCSKEEKLKIYQECGLIYVYKKRHKKKQRFTPKKE